MSVVTSVPALRLKASLGKRIAPSSSACSARYTRKVESPKYVPKGEKPNVSELYDEAKTKGIVEKIQSSTVEQSTKDFLIAAAHRHTVFNFENVAEFYAHSEPQVQRLMEQSALVIIDFDKAIENGFVVMTDEIKEAFAGDYENADD